MSFCYVVLSHTDRDGVLRLVRRIRGSSPDAHVVVRHGDPDLVSAVEVEAAGGIDYVSPVEARWGDFSLAEMAVDAYRAARDLTGAEFVVLVSGQDFPVRDLADWEEEVRSLGVDALLDPLTDQPDDHRMRWGIWTPPGRMRRDEDVLRRAVGRVGTFAPGRLSVLVRPGEPRMWFGVRWPRRAPVRPVKAALWAVLGERAVDSLLRADTPEMRRWFRSVRTPDEWYVSSLLAADPGLRIGLGATTARRFAPGSPNPDWLTPELLADLRRRWVAPFARKVPPTVDRQVLAVADVMASRTRAEVYADAVDREPAKLTWVGRAAATLVDRDGRLEEGAHPAGRPA
ncbi:hypothetical protein [Mobilicoccus pelagius]|uniref:Uncharacterized protein n=1 Tax=Mobilicoccus pelagius NBRC 104925 TaxID=1089455 RepID=H5UMP8_9MICO|nr:hypothetical protein [Mobilicoccus pelagius]GAB47006.1 hypothetical protein MOPEL_003_00290 [Mobilicoccus pelagius NBRC 104925]